MNHYERTLQRDLDSIREGVLSVAGQVDANLDASLRALFSADRELAYETILLDHPINRAVEAVDADCHRFVVRHLPSAGHLRFVSSVLRMNVELERIGDYAETICREVASLEAPIEGDFRRALEALGSSALEMYRSAVDAFDEGSEDRARATVDLVKTIERHFHLAYEELATEGETGVGSTRDRFSKLVVLSMLERVSDQAKNLCEEVIWARQGERKRRRPVQVLFLDKTNAVLAPLAAAAARKSHPTVGRYSIAAPAPAQAIDSEVLAFFGTFGHAADNIRPTPIDWPPERWSDFDVIVALEGKYGDYVDRIPFQSVGLNWEIADKGASGATGIDELYRRILSRVVQLMDTVRGPES